MDHSLGVVVGQVVAGKYRLVKLLGRGGMGSVWRAEHLSLGSPVAVKIIKPQIAGSKTSLARFLREAKAAALLRSPHVVQILEHGSDGDLAFIAMELLEGESLFARLKRDEKLSTKLTATVMTHVGRAMSKAHAAGIVHRDLKPDNVFLVPNEDELVIKVLDFGIAKSSAFALNTTDASPQTQTGALLGTPYYMSPEQATASKDVDHRSDLWAIAVIAYECLLGERPFQSESLGELVLQICARPKPVPSQRGEVPAGFDAWFDRATARDPEERFQSASELTRALRRVLGDASVETTGESAVVPRESAPGSTSDETTDAPLGAISSAAAAATDRDFPPRAPVASGTLASEGLAPTTPAEASSKPIVLVENAAARTEPGLETLDPLAATTAPRGRGVLVRAFAFAAGALALIGIGVALRSSAFGTSDGEANGAPAASAATRAVLTASERQPDPPASSAPLGASPPAASSSPPKAPVSPPARSAAIKIAPKLPAVKVKPPPKDVLGI